jgi:hypothetical protein
VFRTITRVFVQVGAADQLGLLYDSWALGEAGYAPVAGYLELARRLPVEAEPAVWRGLIQILGDIDTLYRGSPRRPAFRAYARATLAPLFVRVGWEAQPAEADNVAVLREDLLNILGRLEDSAVLIEARRRFKGFLQHPSSLSGELFRSTMQIVGKYADAMTYEIIRGLAGNANNSTEKKLLYVSLASAQDFELARRTLDIALSDEVPSAVGLSMITQVAFEQPDLAWQFGMDNWDKIQDKFVAQQRYEFVPKLPLLSTDPRRLRQLRDFINQKIPLDARQNAETSYSDLAFRLEVIAKRLPEIDRWLTLAADR